MQAKVTLSFVNVTFDPGPFHQGGVVMAPGIWHTLAHWQCARQVGPYLRNIYMRQDRRDSARIFLWALQPSGARRWRKPTCKTITCKCLSEHKVVRGKKEDQCAVNQSKESLRLSAFQNKAHKGAELRLLFPRLRAIIFSFRCIRFIRAKVTAQQSKSQCKRFFQLEKDFFKKRG